MAEDKIRTIIAGVPEDESFGHACYIAENLAEIFPNFRFQKICKERADWESWLKDTCEKHEWSHSKSPLVWREYGPLGGNATYIGGAGQFWKFISEYYNINSRLTKDELEALKLNTMLSFEAKRKRADLKAKKQCRRIMIIGAGRSVCPDLVAELVTTPELCLAQGVSVKLYDEPGHFFKMSKIVSDMAAIGGGLKAVETVSNIPDGLVDCDILIILEHISREDRELSKNWLIRNREATLNLAKQIDERAPPHMKVVYCSMGPTCFCANVLVSATKKIAKTNVVVVSAYYGLEMIYGFVNSLGIPLKEVGCPPVWGFLGVNHYVDVNHMVQKHHVYRPNERALKSLEGSTLPLGSRHPVLRWSHYMVHDKNPYDILAARRAVTIYQVGRSEDFQKCKATCDLLRLWYSNETDIEDKIISLGIFSDGTFGIPEGIFFSQPVSLNILTDKSRVWTPCSEFPVPNYKNWMFRSLIEAANMIVQELVYSNVTRYLPERSKCRCKDKGERLNE